MSCCAAKAECDPTKGTGEVLCLGNALLDITFFADTAFLEAQELKPNDATTLDHDRFKTILDGVEGRFTASGHVPGGSAQNVARAIQWLVPSAPGAVTYMGAICPDRIGNILVEKARQSGINGVYETVDDPTGCCLVLVSGEHNENRSLAAYLGGAKKFSLEFLKSNWAYCEKAKFFYIAGFFLPTCFEACKAVGKLVSGDATKKFFLNLGATYIATDYKDKLLELIPDVDVLFGNETEFAAFGRAIGCGEDLKTVAKAIATMPKARADKRVVIITQGAEPVLIAVGSEEVKTIAVPKLAEDRIVDRNGAGDAFVGGFIANFTRGKTLEECVRAGIATAEITIQRLGCTFPTEKPCLDKLGAGCC